MWGGGGLLFPVAGVRSMRVGATAPPAVAGHLQHGGEETAFGVLNGGFVGLDYFFGREGHRGHNDFKNILLTLTGLVASRQDAKDWAKSHPVNPPLLRV